MHILYDNLHDVISDLLTQSLSVNITQKKVSPLIKLSLSRTSAAVGRSGPDTPCVTRTDLEHVFMLLE